MERNMIFLLLLSTVILTMSQELLPVINCTTSVDYVAQARSINVTWMLNSTLPINYLDNNGRYRVLACEAVIQCGNGYEQLLTCSVNTLRYGWRFNQIPLSESFCNVTVAYDDKDDYMLKIYYSMVTCSFSDFIETTVHVYSFAENLVVGAPYKIWCNVHTDQEVNPEIINITWIGPNNNTIMIDNRINVTKTISNGTNHTSTLHFLYFSDEDEGLYICNMAILNNTDSISFKLEGISVPTPNMSLTVLNNEVVGSELSLQCDVNIVRGLTSSVKIIWMKNNTPMKVINNDRIRIHTSVSNDSIFHLSSLQFLYLKEDDESTYTCMVTILDTSTSRSVELKSFDLPIPTVSVTALNQSIGNKLSLRCNVSTVKGITSKVDIVWKVNGKEMERYNGNILENKTTYVYYYNTSKTLALNDNNTIYQCQVVINGSPFINVTDTFILNLSVPIDPDFLLPDDSSSDSVVNVLTVTITIIIILILLLGFATAFIIFIRMYSLWGKPVKLHVHINCNWNKKL